ncbi:TetR/AcrR family transcriptional regulator [Microbacterium sp. YY-03]|uniref:TetR/AcrR family transcriptional regulator n=1 Tax=Microbacterium sp. YY-03 TaxID=3421636 RepID=UPI003D18632E
MVGLRERKKRATEQAIEGAAVDIAFNEGIDAVTVDRVCDIAMVSRSTFFNYYTSREQAIFGRPLEYDRERTTAILEKNGADLIVAASEIVLDAVRGDADDLITKKRVQLFLREPGTTSRVSWVSSQSRERLATVIEEWLDTHPELASLAFEDHATEARLIVGLSVVIGDEVLRHARGAKGEVKINPDQFRTVVAKLSQVVG